MSTPEGVTEGDGERRIADRRRSLGKYVKRMSSVFKRDKPGKSGASPTSVAPSSEAAEQTPQETAASQAPTDEPAALTSTAPAIAPTSAAPARTAPQSAAKNMDRSAMQQERARALFAKYGLTLESHEWIIAPSPAATQSVQRVEKSIRMRVHRSCHHCGSLFSPDKICLQCDHKRCKKCPRHPKKKSTADKDKSQELGKDGVALADKPRRKKVLTITNRAGNERALQPTKQRVRRSCHKCEATFVPPSATICEQCHHIRCTKCPREPAKLQKWPSGYPGDAEYNSDSEVEKQLDKFRRTWRKPRQRVRWECEQCHANFRTGSPQCPGCGHERCDKCTRSPIKNRKKEETFDPQLVAAVEAKLRALRVDPNDSLTSDLEAA